MRMLVAMLAALGALLGIAACKNPGTAGPAQHKTIKIGDGTVLGKNNYGLWKPGDTARAGCRWSVSVKGKTAAKGGPHDAVISGTGTKGGVLNANGCGWFYK